MIDDANQKHAFLIMAHKNMSQVGELLSALDHPRCDFFLLIDLKCKEDFNILKRYVNKGNIYFTNRISVFWGGDTQIKAEILMLNEAISKGNYLYYHFLSGQDYPLKSIEEILYFYDQHLGQEFISIDNNVSLIADRIRYYYPFQNSSNNKNVFGRLIRKVGVTFQKILKVNRIDNCVKYGVGSAFFDITDEFARYLISRREFVENYFKDTFCADEIFLQTVYLNSNNSFNRYHAVRNRKHPFIQDTYFDVCRAIDWTRGTPYTYTAKDIPMLKDTGCMFARKFDFQRDPSLAKELRKMIDKDTK